MSARWTERQDGRNVGRRAENTIPATNGAGCGFEIGAFVGALVLLLAGLHVLMSGVLAVIP